MILPTASIVSNRTGRRQRRPSSSSIGLLTVLVCGLLFSACTGRSDTLSPPDQSEWPPAATSPETVGASAHRTEQVSPNAVHLQPVQFKIEQSSSQSFAAMPSAATKAVTRSSDVTGIVSNQPTLIGTFVVDYHTNAAGCAPMSGQNGNPYYCLGPLGPGPYYLAQPPGRYRVVRVGEPGDGASTRIWSGDASSGAMYKATGPQFTSLDFEHTFGTIVLYSGNWYGYDNSESQTTTLALYRLSQ